MPPFDSVSNFLKWAEYYWELQEFLCGKHGHARKNRKVIRGRMKIRICGKCYDEKNAIYTEAAENMEDMLE